MQISQSRVISITFVIVSSLLVSLTHVARAETAVVKVVLGTATKGGGFQLYGQHLVEVLNATDSSLKVEEMATKGSKQNLPLLEKGKIDIGLVEGNAARQALDGIGANPANLKVLSVMYPNAGMFVVRGDSPYHTIDDLKGKSIAFGTRASGLRILANDVLDGLGLSPETDFKQVILDKAAQGPEFVLNKKVEALWGAGIGWPGFVKVANSPIGARFITPSKEQIKLILQKHPHLKTMSIPAGTYKGQTEQIDSVGLWSLILVRPDLPDDVVYRLARAIHQGEGMLAERLQQGSYTKVQNTIAHVPHVHLHPGALRYYCDHNLNTPWHTLRIRITAYDPKPPLFHCFEMTWL